MFSSDYGYDRWIEKTIDFYGAEQDTSNFLISSSGKSQNMINACRSS